MTKLSKPQVNIREDRQWKRILIVLKDFQTFLKEKGQDTISFDDINLALIKEYETYLFNKKVKGERTTATSTVGNKCVQLIGIIKRAEPYNLIDIHEAKLDKYSKPKKQTRR